MRCWRCRYVWLQKKPDADPVAAPLPERPEHRLSEDVTRILREEAEREQRVRQAEQGSPPQGAGAGSRPDFPEEDTPLVWPMPRRARSGDAPQERATEAGPQLLPAGAGPDQGAGDGGAAGPPVRHRHPGRWGAGLVMTLALAALAVYVLAPRLAAAVPEWAPVLDLYVARVETLRAMLAGLVGGGSPP